MKITVVGAGAVGASCAEYIAIKDFASEVVCMNRSETSRSHRFERRYEVLCRVDFDNN